MGMYNEELVSHIRRELANGSTKETMTPYLTASGLSLDDINRAFAEAEKQIKVGYRPSDGSQGNRTWKVVKKVIWWIAFLAIAFLVAAYIVGGPS